MVSRPNEKSTAPHYFIGAHQIDYATKTNHQTRHYGQHKCIVKFFKSHIPTLIVSGKDTNINVKVRLFGK